MKIFLISGANGFIGGSLMRFLRKRGEAVYPIAREYLYEPEKLYDLVEKVNPTHIIHCASYGNMYTQRNEMLTIQANVNATFNLLNATKGAEYECFIYLSSSSVYGLKDGPAKEEDSLDGNTIYAITKINAEYLVKYFVKRYNKKIVIIRPFSVYGPGEDDSRFIPVAVRAIRNDAPMKLSSGMHDWIYITDFIEALMSTIDNISYTSGQTINVGTGIQYDNYDVVKILCGFKKKKMEDMNIKYVDLMRLYDSKMWVADNTKLKSLGWKQMFSLSDGLRSCWEVYK